MRKNVFLVAVFLLTAVSVVFAGWSRAGGHAVSADNLQK
jgi:hypothetical protein